jgi:hypothetical protein
MRSGVCCSVRSALQATAALFTDSRGQTTSLLRATPVSSTAVDTVIDHDVTTDVYTIVHYHGKGRHSTVTLEDIGLTKQPKISATAAFECYYHNHTTTLLGAKELHHIPNKTCVPHTPYHQAPVHTRVRCYSP